LERDGGGVGLGTAIGGIAILTALSGLFVALRMYETLPARDRLRSDNQVKWRSSDGSLETDAETNAWNQDVAAFVETRLEDEIEAAWTEGRAMSMEEAIGSAREEPR